MSRILATAALAGIAAAQDQQVAFPLRPKLDGEYIDLYMHQTAWSDMSVADQSAITMNNRDRAYLSWSEQPDPFSYFRPNLLGGYVTYDVDISKLPCGCITALYQVLMPARQVDGTLWDRAYWYCGAQQSKFGGESCPEFDVMEANTWGFHTTIHACDAPNEFGHFPAESCDFQGQCEVDIEGAGVADRYGPGEQYDINTLKPFNVRIDYHKYDNNLVGYTTTMTQEGRTIDLIGDCRDYANRMTPHIENGMAFVMSSWRPRSAKWLQGDRCNEECVWPVETVFSNLEFWTSGAKPAPMADVDLRWGRACSHLRSGVCGKDCAECRFSYPVDEPLEWKSDWAKCRCFDDKEYSYGNPCDAEADQSACGSACDSCNLSWPAGDPLRWGSEDAKCRCVPKDTSKITFGQAKCKAANQGICGDSCSDCRWSWPSDDAAAFRSAKAMCRCADGQ